MATATEEECQVSDTQSSSDLDFETRFIQEKLEEVVITSAEEEDYNKYLANVWDYPPKWSESDEGSSSPGSEEGNTHSTLKKYHPRTVILSRIPNKTDLRNFIAGNPVSLWNNSKAEEVYELFNATMRIIQPNELLSVSCIRPYGHLTIDNILKTLGSMPYQRHSPKWEDMPTELKTFVTVFTESSELAHVLHDKGKTMDCLVNFKIRLDDVQSRCTHPQFRNFYGRLNDIVSTLTDDVIYEEHSMAFMSLLLDVFVFSAAIGPFHTHTSSFPLSAGHHKHSVLPDFVFKACYKTFMVGEVKRFCEHGDQIDRSRGKIPCESVGKKECSEASGSSECSQLYEFEGKGDKYPGRSLGSREWYKVRCYLPQLMGEMLAVMQNQKERPKICTDLENAELGFAIEGFKLRFVKMVIRSYHKRDGPPTVEKLLNCKSLYKCDVFLTQEFNLFKAKHLLMFFKMLLAIYYHMSQ